MKAYQSYILTKYDWINEIPSHWDLVKLKTISDIVNGSTPNTSVPEYWGGEIVWITPLDLGKLNGKKYISNSDRKITIKGLVNCGATITPSDSIILSSRAPIGHLAISVCETCTNQGCKSVVVKQNQIISSYLYYFLLVFKDILKSYGQGTTFIELSGQSLKDFSTILPPLPEQQAIANFLDHKTAQIDTLIAQKQRQIERLQEYRTALINQAVTKGLDPTAPMKDSGIAWLGKVPQHWKIARLKYLSTIITEKDDNPNNYEVQVTLENIESNTGKLLNVGAFSGTGNKFVKGDILYNKLRPYLNKAFIADSSGIAVGELLILRPSSLIVSKFLLYRMISHSFMSAINSSTYGAKMPRASWDFIGNIKVPYPSKKEQVNIIAFLESSITRANLLIKKLRLQIEMLAEYRTTLISEAVTGKIDIRDWKGAKNGLSTDCS